MVRGQDVDGDNIEYNKAGQIISKVDSTDQEAKMRRLLT